VRSERTSTLRRAIRRSDEGRITIRYDPFGRRIQKSGPLGTTNYLYDGESVIEEADNSGNVLAQYTQKPGIDQPLSEWRSGAAGYYEVDGLGSVLSLSNAAGGVAKTYAYDSFGRLTTSSGTVTNPYAYTAREYDVETGLLGVNALTTCSLTALGRTLHARQDYDAHRGATPLLHYLTLTRVDELAR
jgi:hypothetical protein